jgi:virulence-associated protein VagC
MRDELRLEAGDTLLIESEGERITLRPVRQQAALKKEHGIWVYQGEPAQDSIPDLIERERQKRLRELGE